MRVFNLDWSWFCSLRSSVEKVARRETSGTIAVIAGAPEVRKTVRVFNLEWSWFCSLRGSVQKVTRRETSGTIAVIAGAPEVRKNAGLQPGVVLVLLAAKQRREGNQT